MNEDGLCVGCGRECLGSMECRCGRQEVNACEECRDSGVTLVCGKCRNRAVRVVPVGLHPCRGFMKDEAGVEWDRGARLTAMAQVGA